MLKGNDVIGLPVVTFDTGERIDKVADLLFDHEGCRVLGFVVDEGGWFSAARVLPFEGVQTVGPDAVIVPTKTVEIIAERDPQIDRVLKRDNVLRGTKLMTTDGRDLGSMRDLYFDERSGAVEGFEVSGGLFADAYEGRSFVPSPQTISIGEDVAFVPPETADAMREQVGGIKGAAQSAGEKVREGAEAVGEQVQTGAELLSDKLRTGKQAIGEKIEEGTDAARRSLTAASGAGVTPLLAEAEGRRVAHEVRDPAGYVIAARGQIVTEQVIERARAAHREQALLSGVGLTIGQAVGGRAGGALSSAGTELREGAAGVKEGATNLWEKVKEKVGDARERGAQELEEKRINAALGRPVTRVILDRRDGVILNLGELITHKAIEQARQEDVLAVLLDSVYKGEPELSQQELRSTEPGSAALEREEAEPDQSKPAHLRSAQDSK